MSAPTLQQILLTVPGFGAQINSFNELYPGVPATQENLETLFAAFALRLATRVEVMPDISVYIEVTNRGGRAIVTQVRARFVPGPMSQVGPAHRTSFSAEGLYEAILWAKDVARSIARDGACVCQATPLVLNLKLAKMPVCFDCMIARALGQAA